MLTGLKETFMRKKFGLKIVLLTILLSFGCIIFWNKQRTYTEYIVTGEELEDIKSCRDMSDESLLYTLNFNGNELFFDPGTKTFYYSLINRDANAYDPRVTFESADAFVRIAIAPVAITPETIASDKIITLIAYNERYFSQYSLKCTTLPLMNIICEKEICDEDVSMQIQLFDNQRDCTVRNTYSDGFIHLRGATTRRFPKKGYRISLTQSNRNGNITANKCNLLGLRNDDDWLLYAAYNDQEKIRHVFSTNLWKYSCAADNALGLDTGMEYKYIELFVNNEYYGLYALGYPIDEKQMKMKKDSETEFLYKKVSWDRETDITGMMTDPVVGYETKSLSANAWIPLREYYAMIYAYSNSNNADLYDSIDIDNAIDIYLFYNFIQAADGVIPGAIKNILIAAKEYDGSYTMIYAPWDMDISWGNDFEGTDTYPYAIAPSQNWLMEVGGIAPLIDRNDPDIWKLVQNKYEDLRNTVWSEESINSLIDVYESDIFESGAYLRDMERWPDGLYADPEDELSLFREHVTQRLAYMDIEYSYGK